MESRNLLDSRNGRFTAFGLMYISEGIPFGFTSIAVVAYLRSQGVGLDDIGVLTGALFLPWAFKWAWAPLVDLFRFNRYGGRKAWIIFCTSMMAATLLLVLALDVANDFQVLVALMVLHNVFAATQDVAIDSLAVSTLKSDERSRGNGFMFGGQYAGIGIGGAGAIALFGLIGFEAALLFMATLLVLNLLFIVFFVHDPDIDRIKPDEHLSEAFRTFFLELKIGFIGSGRGPLLGLLFALVPVGAIGLAYAMLPTIQTDFGLSEAEISRITAANTIFAALGCITGGFLGDRFGFKPTLFATYIATTIPTLALAFALQSGGLAGISEATLAAAIITHGFCYGMAFGIHAAIFMGVSNPAVGGTMFTTFMALSNVAISYTNVWQGQVAENFDYSTVFFVESALVIVALAIIPFLRERTEAVAPQAGKFD